MSAELLLAVLVIDESRPPDFAAAHRAVDGVLAAAGFEEPGAEST